MISLRREFVLAVKETPKMFFAPLVGALRAVVREFSTLEAKQEAKKAEAEFEAWKKAKQNPIQSGGQFRAEMLARGKATMGKGTGLLLLTRETFRENVSKSSPSSINRRKE